MITGVDVTIRSHHDIIPNDRAIRDTTIDSKTRIVTNSYLIACTKLGSFLYIDVLAAVLKNIST